MSINSLLPERRFIHARTAVTADPPTRPTHGGLGRRTAVREAHGAMAERLIGGGAPRRLCLDAAARPASARRRVRQQRLALRLQLAAQECFLGRGGGGNGAHNSGTHRSVHAVVRLGSVVRRGGRRCVHVAQSAAGIALNPNQGLTSGQNTMPPRGRPACIVRWWMVCMALGIRRWREVRRWRECEHCFGEV